MDEELLGDAFVTSAVIAFFVVFGILAVIYAFVKHTKNFDSTGVPKRVEKLEEHEGTTDKEKTDEEVQK